MTAPTLEDPIAVDGEEPSGAALLLMPAAEDASRLALVDGEPADALHVTCWFGGPAADYDEAARAEVEAALADLSGLLPITADILGPALFNPDENPATVLLVQSGDLTALRDATVEALGTVDGDPLADEHPSWYAHLTVAYSDRVTDAQGLTGPVSFDRLVLAWGPDGTAELADEGTTMTADIVTDPADVEQAGPLPDRWEGVLAPLGVPSGDQRMFSPDGGTIRPGELALRWQDEAWPGHDGCVVVGLIETAEIRPLTDVEAPDFFLPAGTPVIWGEGSIDLDSEEGADFARRLRDGYAPWVSVDIDDYESEVRDEDGKPLPVTDDDMLMELPAGAVDYAITWRLMAVTAVATPAFAEARIRPATEPAPEVPAVPASAPSASSGSITAAPIPPVPPAPEPPDMPVDVGAQVTWTDEDGTERQGTVVSVDVDAGTAEVEEDLGSGDSQQVTVGLDDLTVVVESALEQLLAAADPQLPPAAWFTDPELSGPTPLTVTEDGRVFGHLAAPWSACHTGFPGTCRTVPASPSSYAYFHVGETDTDQGPIPTGSLTVGNGHAKQLGYTFVDALEHYDQTGCAVADVCAGEDEHGIWVAGAISPDADPGKVTQLRRAALSGDWRRISGSLELVAALAVNVPGFPIPRSPRAAVEAGRQTSLVAAGVVAQPPTPDPERDALVAAAADEIERRQRARRTAEKTARRIGRDPASRVAAAAERINA